MSGMITLRSNFFMNPLGIIPSRHWSRYQLFADHFLVPVVAFSFSHLLEVLLFQTYPVQGFKRDGGSFTVQ